MTPESALLIAVAVGFAVVSGANDGGALVSLSLSLPSLRPIVAAAALAVALIIVPLVLGTAVATTLASRLVVFEGAGAGALALPVAVAAAVGVVAILAKIGLPTSLTLALIGGITGAGFGFGLPIEWGTIVFVLAIGAAAPAVGLVLGFVIVRLAALLPARGRASVQIGRGHALAFVLLCLAYAANDGQKMLAVFALAFATAETTVAADPVQLVAISMLFFAGTLVGVRRLAGTLGTGVLLSRPLHIVSAEVAGAGAVFGSAAVGAPVSITQSVTAGLIGSGASEGYGKVRWQVASHIAIAWVLTLPAAVLIAGGAGLALRGLG